MAEFSATDAALEGFRVIGRKPGVVAIWAAFYLAAALVIGGLIFALFGAGFLTAFNASPSPDPTAALAAFNGIVPVLLLSIPLFLLAAAVLVTAMHRSVLRPEPRGLAYLRLGGDELRVLLVILVQSVLVFVLTIVGGIVIGVLVGVTPQGLRWVSVTLGVLGLIAVALWVGTRLSLAIPMTLGEGRVRIFESWRLTQGRFWPLLGAYLLAFVMVLLVQIVGSIIGAAALFSSGGGSLFGSATGVPDFSNLSPLIAVGFLINLIVSLASAVIQLVVGTVPPAAAYRDLSPRAQVEAFS